MLLRGFLAPLKGRDSPCGDRLPAVVEASPPEWQYLRGGGGGECTGKHSFLIADRPVSLLCHGEYSMEAHPPSPLPNTGTDPALLPCFLLCGFPLSHP